MDNDIWQLIGALLVVSGAIIAPTVWYFQHNTARLEAENEKIVTKLENTNAISFKSLKEDLKDFREHFDSKISEVYISMDSRNREVKEFVSHELGQVKRVVNDIDAKLDQTRERSHEIEKDLLRLENKISQDYITRDQLFEIMRHNVGA